MDAVGKIEEWMKVNEERAENGKRAFPRPTPDCPEMPMVEDPSVEEIFGMIDQDGSGKLNEKEGFEALYCLVIWGVLDEDEAFAAFDHIGSFAGDDDEVDLGEME